MSTCSTRRYKQIGHCGNHRAKHFALITSEEAYPIYYDICKSVQITFTRNLVTDEGVRMAINQCPIAPAPKMR